MNPAPPVTTYAIPLGFKWPPKLLPSIDPFTLPLVFIISPLGNVDQSFEGETIQTHAFLPRAASGSLLYPSEPACPFRNQRIEGPEILGIGDPDLRRQVATCSGGDRAARDPTARSPPM